MGEQRLTPSQDRTLRRIASNWPRPVQGLHVGTLRALERRGLVRLEPYWAREYALCAWLTPAAEEWFRARTWQDEELAEEVAERTVSFWGRPHQVKPELSWAILGDGCQLISLSLLDTRPNWYVMRVDSDWNGDNFADAEESLYGHLDEIYERLMEQFGSDTDECWTEEEPAEWPVVSLDSGSVWCHLAFHPSCGKAGD